MADLVTIDEFYRDERRLDDGTEVFQFLFEYVDSRVKISSKNLNDSPNDSIASSASLEIAWQRQLEYYASQKSQDLASNDVERKEAEHWRNSMKKSAQHAVFDTIGKLEPQSGFNRRNKTAFMHQEDVAKQPKSKIVDPADYLIEVEDAERREALLTQLFAAYVRDSEERCQHLRKEILERKIFGQDSRKIVEMLGPDRQAYLGEDSRNLKDAINRVGVIVYEEKNRLNDELRKLDPNGTIVPTFQGNSDRRPQDLKTTIYSGREITGSFRHLVFWLAAGNGLCPSVERLTKYIAADLRIDAPDIDYHLHRRRIPDWMDNPKTETQLPGCAKCRGKMEKLRTKSQRS